jgi:major membrane immunogen (membrane-anchored lipoprotein)
MRRLLTPVIVLALGALLSACGSSSSSTSASTTSTSTPSSPKAELAAMKKAAHSQKSVHYVSVNSSSGHRVQTVTDAGAKEGELQATVTQTGQTGQATVIFTGGTAYMRGDAFAMRVYFGFPEATATKYAGKWIAVPSTSPAIDTIASGVTLPSFLTSLFQPMGNLSLVTKGSVIEVTGVIHEQSGVRAVTAIAAPASGQPLPVKQDVKISGAHAGSGTVTMSNWGEPVHVSAPKGAVPLANLAPGGG